MNFLHISSLKLGEKEDNSQKKYDEAQGKFAFSENNRTFVGTLLKIRIYGKLRKARIA